ncbi:ABC transporter substrate-binding protein, partial [Paraburkholderia sp. SIMBA_061]
MLKEFRPGQSGSGTRNPNYHGDAWFDEVEFISVTDPVARTTSLLTGDVDYIDRVDVKTLN